MQYCLEDDFISRRYRYKYKQKITFSKKTYNRLAKYEHWSESAEPNEKGEWVCGLYKIEELNKCKMRVWGSRHPDVKALFQKEDNDCKRWNNYVKRVNQTRVQD